MAFNENTRVKIPAILHLCRLGFEYIPTKKWKFDESTNIFTDIFFESVKRINRSTESFDKDALSKFYENISLVLDNEDLGKAFYEMLTATSGIKLIDFHNFSNNSFHVVTELTCKNGDDEFRPDITLLINGMPLAFIEVKKPNNTDGILAERERINTRFKNRKFKKFINISQILVFSNNMEYDEDSVEQLQGSFYSTTARTEAIFNCFREGEKNFAKLSSPDIIVENTVLKDNNLLSIKSSPEFETNKNPESPTNRLLTSLFFRDRFAMWLRYGFAYVNTARGIEKHIMRYPQFFATKAIEQKIDSGIKKGIIWHTQGSGKTALAFFNVKYLTDYFQRKRKPIPKFYFIVDRLDLLIQASQEFTSRGLVVHTVDTKQELVKDFQKNAAINNLYGRPEITVVNIQKFQEDSRVINVSDYNIKIQRIYFLDEVHRSYNPEGSFLANLFSSDRDAILIGLTGTPLISADRKSKEIFGDYIHKYYYNLSIADGYTLKLIREGIETSYKIRLQNALKEIKILHGDADKRVVYSHPKFVEPMLDYIIKDFINSRIQFGDHSIGSMVVCDSADQAKKLFEIFVNKYNPQQKTAEETIHYSLVAEPVQEYVQYKKERNADLTASLILHDVGSKEERKEQIDAFKEGKFDFLFVYNMLLTGFDAKRLKKLYMNRVVKDHNLLQTLTRVNRPYNKFRYGFVVDFADIRKEFDVTNKAYFDELQEELGDELKTYSDLFKTKEEIEEEISGIKELLFHYDLGNAEIFSQQISQISDRTKVLEIKKALENARNLYNIIRLQGLYELLANTDFKKLNQLYNEASRHLDLVNFKVSLENNVDTTNLLNVALENVVFMFRKISEQELKLADELKNELRKTREEFSTNFDPADPRFVTLYDELKRIFQKKNLDEVTQDEMNANIDVLRQIYEKIKELNRKNNLLKAKYENDSKYARIHKRILENDGIAKKESAIRDALADIKQQTDEKIEKNFRLLENDGYFEQLLLPFVVNCFQNNKIELEPDSARFIQRLVAKEYLNEFQGVFTW